ncbi:hypothetical protein ACFQPG_00350 [Sphingomonas sp. GCM10030256]|uniref:hypothetical protein n=1 Tax=Sphingomonas sp. GCM10030256 TaxID=3273427 RepID=UPI0036082C4B
MNRLLPILSAALAACGGDDVVAENAVAPDLNLMSEVPGDWSALSGMIGRTPVESGLFEESPVLVDLNAMLGPDVARFRAALHNATPLVREGRVIVTRAHDGQAFLVIDPAQYGLLAGLRQGSGWRTFETPGADVGRPASVQRMIGA